MPGPPNVASSAAEGHPQQHVFQGGEGRQQVERLEHVPELGGAKSIAAGLGEPDQIDAVQADLARVRRADPGNHVQERRLAAATGTQQDHLLTRRQLELRDVQNRQQMPVGLDVRLLDFLEQQHDLSVR